MNTFSHPSTEFYPVPWWAWNGNLDYDEMRQQLDLMHAQGIQEFFIFALYGLVKPDFLSEEWFQYVSFTLDEAEKRGMKVWIYDELNWPSGSAGGHVVREHPEKREFVFRMSDNLVQPGAFVQVEPENLLLLKKRTPDGAFHEVEVDEYGYFTNHGQVPCHLYGVRLTPSSRPMTNVMGVGASWGQRGALDMLDPESFRLWMSYIYDEYDRRFHNRFGKVIRGFFTDEPQTHDYDGPTVPYTPSIIGRFKDTYGYDLVPHLLKLYLPDIPGADAFRRDYYALVAQMFSDNMATVSNWCRDRGLLFTGHCIWEEIGPNMQSFTLRNGDPHRLLERFTAPGCDLLGHTTPYQKDVPGVHRCWAHFGYPATIYTARYVSSTARWSGAKRTMCEAFGVRDFHCGMESQKLINDFLAGMGINLINDNTLVYSMSKSAGAKHVRQPSWRLYHCFTECSARLSWFAAWGTLDAAAAVMVPISTIWSQVRVMDWTNAAFKPWSDVFIRTGEILLRNHVDFEYVFEDAPGDPEALKVFQCIYLPRVDVLPSVTARRLEAFRNGGGRLVAIGNVPRIIGEDAPLAVDALLEDVEQLPGALPKTGYSLEGTGNEDVLAALRQKDGERLLLVSNQTPGIKTITLRHSLAPVTEILIPDTGDIFSADGKECHQVMLDEGQSVLFRMAATPSSNARPMGKCHLFQTSQEKTVLTMEGPWQFEFGKKNLFKPALEIRLDPLEKGLDERWYAMPPCEWYHVVNDRFPFNVNRSECTHYWLRGSFVLRERIPENLSLLFANDEAEQVFVNGMECKGWGPEILWDQDNIRCLIAPACRLGDNSFYVRLRISHLNDSKMKLAEITRDLVLTTVFYGDFAVAPDRALIPPPREIVAGSWRERGFAALPTYGVYRKSFQWDGNASNRPVLVIPDARSTVEASLNGIPLGARCWKPFRFDLASAIRPGENQLEIRVGGTIGNFFRQTSFITKEVTVDYGLLSTPEIRDMMP